MRAKLLGAAAGSLALAAILLPLSGAAARGGTTIKVGDNFFAPTSITVSTGTTVKFKWTGENVHDIVKKRGPGGAFSSVETSDRGVNFTKKLKKSGTYRIICSIHPDEMKMKIVAGGE